MSPTTKESTRFAKCCESSGSVLRSAVPRPLDATPPTPQRACSRDKPSMVSAVVATPAALTAICGLVGKVGPITFFQSHGRFPMCFVGMDFVASDYDVFLGHVGGCQFYLDHRYYDIWKHAQIELDVDEGEPHDFWLSAGVNKHFVIRPLVLGP